MSHFQLIIFSFILTLLIFLAAFFSLAETGLMAVNRYRLRHKARLKKRYALNLINLLKRPDRILGVTLIGSTFANILASSLATLIAFHFWGDKGALLTAIVLTFIILIFAEIVPKTLAAMYADQVARLVCYPIYYLLKIIYPVVWVANGITNNIFRLFRIRITVPMAESLSREELRTVVYETAGKISRQYQNMLLSILDLNKLTVDDVMIPLQEVTGIDIEQPWEVIARELNNLKQDWIPFYRHNTNQIVGIFYSHHVFRLLSLPIPLSKESLLQLLQPPYFVPEGTSLYAQLSYFQRSHDKIAFVVDEYGEIQGLLTLNDILEEIVGDFTFSIGTKRLSKETDGSYLVDGAITVREFNRETEWELPLTGPRTINGLIIEHLEALPHQATTVLIAHYPIEIIHVKANRVKLARVFPRLKGVN